MKMKDIKVGNEYTFLDTANCNKGCSVEYFSRLHNKKIIILKKLSLFDNKNTIHIQGYLEEEKKLVRFWCSPGNIKGEE